MAMAEMSSMVGDDLDVGGEGADDGGAGDDGVGAVDSTDAGDPHE